MLEEPDALLVQQLQRDGRTAYEALGRAVGLTRTAARARVHHLLDHQVIRVVALPDTAVAGRPVVAHVSAEVSGPALAVAHAVAELPSSAFVSVTAGEYSVVAELRTADDEALATDLDRLRALPGIRAINVVRALIMVRDAYRPRRARGPVALDGIDRRIAAALERDGRMPYSQLGPLVGLSPAATRTRVQRLTRSGAIHVTVLVAAAHTGRLARAGLGITVASRPGDTAERVASLPDITYVMTGTGRYDVIAGADSASETSLLTSIDEVRHLPSVTRVHSWRHLQVVKERYAQISQPGADISRPGG